MAAVESVGKILQALRIDVAHGLVDHRFGVGKLERRHGFREVAAVGSAPVTRLSHRQQVRIEGLGGVRWRLHGLSMDKVGGSYQTVQADTGLAGEMMKHQHPAAKPVSANLERG